MADKSYEERFAQIIRENERRERRGRVVRTALALAAFGGVGSLAGHVGEDWTLLVPLLLIAPWLVVSGWIQVRGR